MSKKRTSRWVKLSAADLRKLGLHAPKKTRKKAKRKAKNGRHSRWVKLTVAQHRLVAAFEAKRTGTAPKKIRGRKSRWVKLAPASVKLVASFALGRKKKISLVRRKKGKKKARRSTGRKSTRALHKKGKARKRGKKSKAEKQLAALLRQLSKPAKKAKKRRPKAGRMTLVQMRKKYGKRALAKRAKAARVTNPFAFLRQIKPRSLKARARYDAPGSALRQRNREEQYKRVIRSTIGMGGPPSVATVMKAGFSPEKRAALLAKLAQLTPEQKAKLDDITIRRRANEAKAASEAKAEEQQWASVFAQKPQSRAKVLRMMGAGR